MRETPDLGVIRRKPVTSRLRSLGVGVIANDVLANGTSPRSARATDAPRAGDAGAATAAEPVYDIDRLERAIAGLVEENVRLREVEDALTGRLREKEDRILSLADPLSETGLGRRTIAV